MQINRSAGSLPAPPKRVSDSPTWQVVSLSQPVTVFRLLAGTARRWFGPTAIALILFELAIRLFVYSPRPQIFDPRVGSIPKPGSTWINGREGYGRMHWNRQGIRGHDLPAPGTRGVHRIVVLGDSFCEAESVDDDQTYCAQFEKLLSERLHQRVWVGNCGRAGLDGSDFLYYLPIYQRKFHPDLTVLTLNLSDLRMTGGKLSGAYGHFDPAAPMSEDFSVQPPSERREQHLLDNALPRSLRSAGYSLIDHSSLALYGAARLYSIHWKKLPADLFIVRKEQIASTAQLEQYLAKMVSLTRTPIACVYVAPWNSLWVTNNHWDAIAARHLREATGRLHIPFVDTGPAFHHRFDQTGQPANGFYNTDEGPGYGHLNAAGHRIVAEAMTPTIARIVADGSGPHLLRLARENVRAAGRREAPRGIIGAPDGSPHAFVAGRPASGSASS